MTTGYVTWFPAVGPIDGIYFASRGGRSRTQQERAKKYRQFAMRIGSTL